MTASALYTASGSGTLAYRIVIDGCPYEPVTLASMERDLSVTVAAGVATAVAAGRKDGLVMRDAQFSIKADPVACKLDVGGLEIKLVDINNTWSRVFDLEPSATTWLTASVTDVADATVFNVAATGMFPATGLAWVDGECFAYGDKTGTTFTGTKRGVLSPDSDAAQWHYITDGIRTRTPAVTNWPALWEGRRIYVYRYDEGDDLTGDGLQIYRGVITTGPRFDGVTWTLGVDHILGVLDQTFGEDLADPMKPRGIHYTEQGPFGLSWQQGYPPTKSGGVRLVGFYDDDADHDAQWNFCDALTTAIAASFSAAGATGTLSAVSEGPTGWHLQYRTASSSPKDLIVRIESTMGILLDPPLGAWPGDYTGGVNYPKPTPEGEWGNTQTYSGVVVGTAFTGSALTASFDYYFYRPMQGGPSNPVQTAQGQVPRGSWSWNDDDDGRTIYLDARTPVPTDTTSIVAKGKDPTGDDYEETYSVDLVTTATRSILISPFTNGRRRFLPDSLPEIRLGLLLQSASAPQGSSIAGVLDFVSAQQQQYGTLGIMPMLRAGDFDTTTWHAIYDPMPPVNNNRLFVTFSPVSIVDIMREELKAAGCFLALDSTGRLVPARIRLPAQSEVSAVATIDADTLLTDKARISHEVSGLGQVNQVNYQTGYVPSKDEFGDRFIVRDVSAFGQSARTMEQPIAQKSVYLGETTQPLTAASVLDWIASPILGALAGSYAIDTIDAAQSDAVQVGQPVIFDCPYLVSAASNDSAGYPGASLGVLGKVSLVLGKVWGAYDPRIRFTVLSTRQTVGGYAPEAAITAQTNTSGNTWSLTLSSGVHPPGTTSANFFAAGDLVRVVEYGVASATTKTGTVVSCVTTNCVVTFTASWTPGASSWYLTIGDSTVLLTAQQRFCQVADSTGVITWSDADKPAKVFAS